VDCGVIERSLDVHSVFGLRFKDIRFHPLRPLLKHEKKLFSKYFCKNNLIIIILCMIFVKKITFQSDSKIVLAL